MEVRGRHRRLHAGQTDPTDRRHCGARRHLWHPGRQPRVPLLLLHLENASDAVEQLRHVSHEFVVKLESLGRLHEKILVRVVGADQLLDLEV
jgi:hypothetical protein